MTDTFLAQIEEKGLLQALKNRRDHFEAELKNYREDRRLRNLKIDELAEEYRHVLADIALVEKEHKNA